MSAAALVTLIAMIISVEGDLAVLDRGRTDGLRPGDVGRLYYTILVGSEGAPRTIEAGTAQVVETGETTAKIRAAEGFVARVGFAAEFEIPRDRLTPPEPAPPEPPTQALPPPEPQSEPPTPVSPPPVAKGSEPTPASTSARSTPPPASPLPPPPLPLSGMAEIPAGSYEIGSDLKAARFYNQHPRFRHPLPAFWIDRRPARRAGSGKYLTGLTHAEATAHCQSRGWRLPNEFEWEVALRELGPAALGPPHEWTSSWYRPYPANPFPEAEYGETYRVLRGRGDDETFDPRRRRFMAPGLRRPEVGFRCVRGAQNRGTEARP